MYDSKVLNRVALAKRILESISREEELKILLTVAKEGAFGNKHLPMGLVLKKAHLNNPRGRRALRNLINSGLLMKKRKNTIVMPITVYKALEITLTITRAYNILKEAPHLLSLFLLRNSATYLRMPVNYADPGEATTSATLSTSESYTLSTSLISQ